MRWLADHPCLERRFGDGPWSAPLRFGLTLLLCWAISPITMLLIVLIAETRMPSLSLDLQFWSFFPGDFFLGMAMATLLCMAESLPDDRHWYNARWWHISLQMFTLTCAGLLTYGEFRQGYYPFRVMMSPSKAYHHIGLYGLYGYAILSTLVAVVAGTWRTKLFPMLAVSFLTVIAPWCMFVYHDATLSPEEARPKAANAHSADWKPIPCRITPLC